MIKNYLKVAFRNILRHKFYSIINITGLVIGMTCCLLIFIYVQDELSYDKFHKDHQNLYRIALHGRISGQEVFTSNSCLPLGPAMRNEIPGVESFIRVISAGRGSGLAVRYEDKSFTEEKTFYSDSNFFSFFSFRLLQGDPKTALKEPNAIVITQAMANKYFGNQDAMGKTLIVGNDKIACRVTGVAEGAPGNSHLQFNAIISFVTVEKDFYQGWGGNSHHTYIRKSAITDVNSINSKLEDLVVKYFGKELTKMIGITFEKFREQGGVYSYYVYPIADTRLYSGLDDDFEPGSDISFVYIFSGVGIFILLIACINFMNLSTARSAGRAKEVGLRKTLGSQRKQMVLQFLSESFVYSLLAILLAIGVTYVLLPYFNLLAGKQLNLAVLASPVFILASIALILVVGLIAGSYPAFYLTSFSAVEVLKGRVRAGMKSGSVRSSLVVFQFAVSTFLIIATMVVYLQLSHMQTKSLGLDKSNVLTIAAMDRLGKSKDAFKTAVAAQASVQNVSFSNNNFPGMNNTTVVRHKGIDVDHMVGLYYGDWDHLDVMKFELKTGRFFSRDVASDSMTVVINEAAVREFGLKNPLEEELTAFEKGDPEHYRIIGVVKDFNFETLKEKIRPVVIGFTSNARQLMVRYEGDPRPVISSIEAQWKILAPGEPFEYSFLDQEYDSLFRSEMRLRDIFTVFSFLAILIACLGLFALASFTTEQRTKEIGVRKVMGASVYSLTLLLSREFTSLVLIAILPAVAVGWYVANWWLSDFNYRIELSPIIFVASALIAIVIAWVTVSYQSIKAANSNPVSSLRYE